MAPHGAVGALIYYLGNSEPESARFVERFLQPGMVFFDVGAHIGEYSLIASRRVGAGGSVHAFEAQLDTFELLKRNCIANHADNVQLNACAVAEGEGEVEFDVCAEPAMSSMAAKRGRYEKRLSRIRVPATSLDSYCRRTGLWPDLLKIDVEGAEWLVLRGAAETLWRPTGPTVIFECLPHTYARFGSTAESVIAYLESFGYGVWRISPEGELLEAVGCFSENIGYNLVALKR
jgi:FkbM family methyltransferase